MASIRTEDFGETIGPESLKPGLVLYYRGDEVPYVDAPNLIRKGQKKHGTYLLPAFTEKEDGSREWQDLPGQKRDRYEIERIEKGRISKTKNQRLPDLVVIKSEGYADGIRFGLRRKDVCAKFGLLMDMDFEVKTDSGEVLSEADKAERRRKWREEVQESGW